MSYGREMLAILVGFKAANKIHQEREAVGNLSSALEGDPCVVSWEAQQRAARIVYKHGHRIAKGLAKSLRRTQRGES